MADNIYENWQAPTRNAQVAVGVASTQISEQRNKMNPRKAYVFSNSSPNAADIITINLGGNAAVANIGIILHQGDVVSDSNSGDYEVHQGSITAICATANGQLSIYER